MVLIDITDDIMSGSGLTLDIQDNGSNNNNSFGFEDMGQISL